MLIVFKDTKMKITVFNIERKFISNYPTYGGCFIFLQTK